MPGGGALDVQPVFDWLVDGARGCNLPQDVLRELCGRLAAVGCTLNRASVFVLTLHPIVAGRSFQWRAGSDEIHVGQMSYEVMASETFTNSPVSAIYKSRAEFRRRLADASCALDFPLLEQLRNEGTTDYLGLPLEFTDGAVHVVVFDTKQPGGFSAGEVDGLRRVRAPLARVAEAYALRRTARSLIDAFLGHQVGQRVLSGQVKRGDGEDIHAVIWFCDLRDTAPAMQSK